MNTTSNSIIVSSCLPTAYHCVITWWIPDDFGGMTNAMLHRSRAFATYAGQKVDILTFNFELSLQEIECELRADGTLTADLALRNLWNELARLSDSALNSVTPGKAVVGKYERISAEGHNREERSDAGQKRRIRMDAEGSTLLQTDYLRMDGTVFVSDRLDLDQKGVRGGRLVTLCDNSGEAVASWNQIWPLYLFWLDLVVADRETFMIIDSKFTASFMSRYRRDNVITMHQLHSAHVSNPPYGELSPQRKHTFDRLNKFDAIVLLTVRQKNDIDLVYGPVDNLCVVPNSRSTTTVADPLRRRGSLLGVILARFTKAKRLDHAVRAIQVANSRSQAGFQLNIYGGGSQEIALEQLIQVNEVESFVHLYGFDPEAKRHFGEASFTLLTSRSEGLPLVLLEAMSMGCIPIAYDIAYGPADIITDGIDGFLVENGNVDALASAIVQLGNMSESEVLKMRNSAISRALDFSDEVVVDKWGQAMRAAVDRKLAVIVKDASPK